MTNPSVPHQPFTHRETPVAGTAPVAGVVLDVPPAVTATRHLSAAAYLDDDFRHTSLKHVYYQAKRLVAPSYGFDLITVLGHCLQANRVGNIRDGAIVAVLVASACVAPTGVFTALALLVLLYILTTTWRLFRDTTRQIRADGILMSFAEGYLLERVVVDRFNLVARIVGAALLLVPLGSIAAAFGAATVITSDGSTAGQESVGAFLVVTTMLLVMVVFALPVAANIWRLRLLQGLTPGNVPSAPARSRRFDEIWRQQQGNTVVYSGYRPFVGSGLVWKNWGFAQRLVRRPDPMDELVGTESEREFDIAPFTAQELVDRLRTELSQVATDTMPERRIPGLTVDDRIFQASTEASHLSPESSPQRMADLIRNPTAPERHYLVCQVVSWRGELVTTVYVHVAVQGRSLYIEFTSTVLPPCKEQYRIVDQVGFASPGAYLREGLKGLLQAPQIIGRAPANLVRVGWHALLRSGWATKGEDRMRQGYDYGAEFGVRELGMAEETRNHIQTQELDKYRRIVERRLLATVLDFLEERDVDTTEYRQRAMSVLNNGTIFGRNATVEGDMISQQTIGQQHNHRPGTSQEGS